MSTSLERWSVAGALVVVVAASNLDCGARTALEAPSGAGGSGAGPLSSSISLLAGTNTSSSSATRCHEDAECDDGIDCTIDSCQAGFCAHAPDATRCDDGLLCTFDSCDPVAGCQNELSNGGCDDGIDCTIDVCDAASDSCTHEACDSKCDDGSFCNGVERCDTTLGCVSSVPACQLDGCMSQDDCDEAGQTCFHSNVDPGQCLPKVSLVVVTKSGDLQRVDPYLGTVTAISQPALPAHLDIAILGGRWFAVDSSALLELKPGTNTTIASYTVPHVNSLGAGPDGMLYGADYDIYRFDPDTGAPTLVGELPGGYESSGDIAYFAGRLFISTDGPCGGALVSFDPASGAIDILGGDGLGCVYGLAATADTLFILNCDGKVGTFDPVTGEARVISTTFLAVYGADVLPD